MPRPTPPPRELSELIAASDRLIAELWHPHADRQPSRKAIRWAVVECCPDWSPGDRARALELVSYVFFATSWFAFEQVFPVIGAARDLGRATWLETPEGRASSAPKRRVTKRPKSRN